MINSKVLARLERIAPGVPALAHYNFSSDFRHDILAGLSVAAVALPVAVAYAELAGFELRSRPLFLHPAAGCLCDFWHIAKFDGQS